VTRFAADYDGAIKRFATFGNPLNRRLSSSNSHFSSSFIFFLNFEQFVENYNILRRRCSF
jgi:hypothetical protein